VDDEISAEIATKIFVELVTMFPTTKSRKGFGRVLLLLTIQAINESRKQSIVVGSKNRVQEKVDAISDFSQNVWAGRIDRSVVNLGQRRGDSWRASDG
jgi:hypothetical protein